MTDHFSTLNNRSVFVDSNIILYHLSALSEDATSLLERGEQGRIRLVTSVRVLDEVFFKYMLLAAAKRFGWRSKVLEKLRRDKAHVKAVAQDMELLRELVGIFDVAQVTEQDLLKTLLVQQEYGLFGNDALVLVLMSRLNLRYLATADSDFGGVEWLRLVQGDWLPETTST